MRLGAFTVVDADPDRPETERVRLVVRLAEEAEGAGLSSLWVAEHHFLGGGACPSPAVVLAACGMRTRALRLGSLVSVLPFHRPVDIAEEYALVDQLTDGRLNFGVGSGYLASEFAGFGVDPASKRDRFDSALSEVLTGFSGEPMTAGPPGTPPVRLNVRPVQQPHPPIWVAVQRREAVAHVARKGWSIALVPYATVDSLEDLEEEIAEYRQELPDGVHGKVAAAVHLYGGERVELARAAFRRYLEIRHATGSTFFVRKAQERPQHASPEAIESSGLALLGSPEQVVQGLERFVRLGVDELLGIFDFGGLPPEEVWASVHAVGDAWARRPSLAERVRDRAAPGPDPSQESP